MKVDLLKYVRKILKYSIILFVLQNVFQSSGIGIKIKYPLVLLWMLVVSIVLLMIKVQMESGGGIKHCVLYINQFVKKIDLVVLIFCLVYLIDLIVLPILHHIPLSNSIDDAGMMMMIFLYFPFSILVRMKEINLLDYKNIFINSVVVLGMWFSIMWIFENVQPGFYTAFLNFLYELKCFNIQPVLEGYGMIRIVQSNMLLLGVGILLFTIVPFSKGMKWEAYRIFSLFILIFGMCTTYLKSFMVRCYCLSMLIIFILLIQYIFFHRKNGNAFLCVKILLICFVSVLLINSNI